MSPWRLRVIEAGVLLSFMLLLDSGDTLDDRGAHSIHLK